MSDVLQLSGTDFIGEHDADVFYFKRLSRVMQSNFVTCDKANSKCVRHRIGKKQAQNELIFTDSQ